MWKYCKTKWRCLEDEWDEPSMWEKLRLMCMTKPKPVEKKKKKTKKKKKVKKRMTRLIETVIPPSDDEEP